MSKLNDLMNELCPDGVEFKKVKDVYTRIKGTPITASKMKEIETPDGEIRIFAGGKTMINANEEDIPKANITRVPAVLVQSRGVIDAVYCDKPFTFKNEMWAYTHEEIVSVKYLYYVLKNNIQQFRDTASGMGSLPQISLKVTEEFVLPVPPLEVQREIVHILDYFTLLTAELTAELTARQQQYEYYRDLLLTFDRKSENALTDRQRELAVEWLSLNQIAQNCDNQRKPVTSSNREAGEYPYYGASGIVDYVSDYLFDGDYLLISEDGNNLVARNTPIAFSITGKNWVNNHAHVLKFETYATRRFVEFYLNSIDLSQWITGGAQPKLNQKNLNLIPIPIPSIEEQERIVSILDRFDALCNDIKSGLPAEIEAREKQYEYYRDKLLSFKELSA